MKRRPLITTLGLVPAALLSSASAVRAQTLPAKPIRLIVGYSAGGAVDIIARAIAQQL